MTIGTLFTLFVVPSVYVLLAKEHRATKKSEEREPGEGDPALGQNEPLLAE